MAAVNPRPSRCWQALLLLALPLLAQASPDALELHSPNGKARLTLEIDEQGQALYSVAWKRQPVLAPSPLGVQLRPGERIERGLRLVASRRSEHDSRHPLIANKASQLRDHYRQLELELADPQGRRLGLVLRAYDDGIAFRYRLPVPTQGDLEVSDEQTGFVFAAPFNCHAFNQGRFGSSHEGEYDPIHSSHLRSHHLYVLPLACASQDLAFAIAEADLDRYAALYLAGRADGLPGVQARLSPRVDGSQRAVILPRQDLAEDGHLTPWRVLMLGDSAGALIDSNLIAALNPPTTIADTGWIVPGKSAWDWWSGGLAPDVDAPGMNTATLKRYIDHAAGMKLDYMLIDDGWYVGSSGNGAYVPEADITLPKPEVDLPALVEHARRRGVGLWLWAHWRALEGRVDEVFARYQAMGIKGVKVDFMERDDQQMVEFYHRMLASAARHRLMLNLHGAYRPTGLNRTWPNYVTQEGVLGAEYNKWSRRITPTHNVTLPYTRMLLGPMDYTPGGFRNMMPADFSISFRGPQVMGTRAHQLAMYVVYESAVQMVADSPDVYIDAAGSDFLQQVPTSWDETRFLAGEPGQYIVLARRSGRDWYIGAMANESPRQVELDLEFLPAADYQATIWSDGIEAGDARRSQQAITAAQRRISLNLAGSGGAVIQLRAAAPRIAAPE
jgi:alpha-glucosidase